MGSSYRERVLASLMWLGGTQLVGQVVSWASTVLVIRLLAPGDYGLMAMATLFVAFAQMLSEFGIGAAIIQAEDLTDEDLPAIQAFILLFNGLAFVLTLTLSPLIAAFFEEPRLVDVLRVLSVTFLLVGIYVLPQSRLMRELDFSRKARVDFASTVTAALVTLACAWFGLGVWALVVGNLTNHGLRAIGFNWILRGVVLPRWSTRRGRRFLDFGSVVVLDRLLWFLYQNLDITIAGKVLGAQALGLYSVALQLAAIPLDKVLPVITQVALPAVSRIQSEPARVAANMLRALRYGNQLFLPVFWGMALVAPDAIPFLLGDPWLGAVLPFQLVCVILPMKAVGALLPPALFGLGRPGVNVANMLISLVLLGGGFAVGVQRGLEGLAAAWAVVYPVVFLITTTRALPVIGLRWRDLLSAWFPAIVSALVMSAAVLGVQWLTSDWPEPIRLVAAIAAGAGAYVLCLIMLDRDAIRDLRSLRSGA